MNGLHLKKLNSFAVKSEKTTNPIMKLLNG